MRQLQRTYLAGWQQIAAKVRPDASEADLEVRMHAVFGILNSTPYNARLDATADVRAVLVDAALGALFGAAVTTPER